MNMLKRSVSILLVIAMLLPLAACSESTENSASDSTAETNTPAAAETSAETVPEEEEKLLPDLPENLDFNGEEVRIMHHPAGSGDWSDWGSRDLYSEALTGEPINDAVFERNIYVEDKLDVDINILEVGNQVEAVRTQATAGTGDYHVSTTRIGDQHAIVFGGYLMDLYSIPNMDLKKPWYDSKCIEEASLYDLLFFVTGSMIILDDDSTASMVFNKQLIANHKLENPYTLVQEGTWTFDKMEELADAVDNDTNGNGQVDIEGDCFGILWQRDAITSFLHGGGSRIIAKNAEGEPEYVFESENTVTLMDKIDSFMFRPELVQNMHNHSGIYSDIYAGECEIFKANNALFMWMRMRVAENLRDMEADFGIIPVPKLTESQDKYSSTVTVATAATICIPNDASLNLDMVGAVIELLSAEGHYGLLEAYYETNLGTKISRDPESTQMLDIIMGNRVYDTGEIYAIANFPWTLFTLTQGSGIGVATLIQKHKKRMESSIKNSFIKPMRELAEQRKGN